MSVSHIGKKTNCALSFSPTQVLASCQQEVGKPETGAFERAEKLLVLALDDRDGAYAVSWRQCGMKSSQIVALLEIAKAQILEDMGY